MEAAKKLPVYAKLSLILIGLLAFFYILVLGQDILVPLIFATIFAILLNPIVNFLSGKGVNRILAIILALIAAIVVLFGLVYFISSQLAMFSESFPLFKQKFSGVYNDLVDWVSKNLNISHRKINAWMEKNRSQVMGFNSEFVGQTLGTIGGILVIVLLLPVYIFLILFYKSLLLEFIARLFKNSKQELVAEVLVETKVLVQSYLVGLLIEAAIVATLNSVGLLIIGIEYAILIGIIGAILNLIPYIGGLVATAIPMLLAIALNSPADALWVLAAYLIVQFVDNNFIVPMIVASKVKVNALVSIIVVLIGGALWGVAGMFLSIPLTAIIKVIFDRIESLKPFGYLLGDDQPHIGKQIFKFNVNTRKVKSSKSSR